MSTTLLQEHEALRPVIYELGAAVYLSQQLETSLLCLVAILRPQGNMVNYDSIKDGLSHRAKSTLGTLLKEFRDKLPIPANYAAFIKEGVDARNYVVHGFLNKNHEKLLTAQGRVEIVEELRDLQHVVNDRLMAVNQLVNAALKVFGGSLENIRKDVAFRFEPDEVDFITRH